MRDDCLGGFGQVEDKASVAQMEPYLALTQAKHAGQPWLRVEPARAQVVEMSVPYSMRMSRTPGRWRARRAPSGTPREVGRVGVCALPATASMPPAVAARSGAVPPALASPALASPALASRLDNQRQVGDLEPGHGAVKRLQRVNRWHGSETPHPVSGGIATCSAGLR